MIEPKFNIPTFGEVNFELDLVDLNHDFLLNIYFNLQVIRFFERKCAQGKQNGIIGGPVHLAVGQEAIPVGLSEHLNPTDSVFSAHRSHAHLVALGSKLEKVFAEILGKAGGVSGGFGGSMHMVDKSVGFQGSVPIVSGTVPLALGTALASKFNKSNAISVCYFGDGAIEEGIVHESLNLASLMNLPVLFVCENNYMASHMHISERQNNGDLTRFAKANGIESIRLDGNDVLSIYRESKSIINLIRKTSKPFFMEALTYRQLGHVDWREDIDVGVSRSQIDIDMWKSFDPITRLKQSLLSNEVVESRELSEIDDEAKLLVEKAWESAKDQSEPEPDRLLETVFRKDKGAASAH